MAEPNVLSEIIKQIQTLRQTSPLYDQREIELLMQRYDNEILKLRQENERSANVETPRTAAELRKSSQRARVQQDADANPAIRQARVREREEVLAQRRTQPVRQCGAPTHVVIVTSKHERKTEIENGFRRLYPLMRNRIIKERMNEILREKKMLVSKQQQVSRRREEEVALLQEMDRQRAYGCVGDRKGNPRPAAFLSNAVVFFRNN